jgi:hypothetical protein
MRYLLLLLVICILTNNSIPAQQAPVPNAIPTLSVETGSGKTALTIHKLDIRVSVTGNIANTVYDITFYNPFDRVLEGSFEFPLGEGQSVFRYGLEVNGNLREGVVVEKQQARVAYENTVRQNIDPGLIEKTRGNSYRTRIYPIPAKGYKRVVIGVEQSLQYIENALQYHLPLYSIDPVAIFSVKAIVYNSERPEASERSLAGFSFDKNDNDWVASFMQQDIMLASEIKFTIPFSRESPLLSFTGEHKGQTYFYLALPLQQEYIEKKHPSVVTVLWDISASGEKRDTEKEMAVLRDYLSELKTATVLLIPFNNRPGKTEKFTLINGNSDALLQRVKRFSYDGGTQLGGIDLTKDSSEQVLLFTDGISTFGKKDIIPGKAPVALISSAANADHAYMKYVALQTKGIYLNLDNIGNEEAVRSLLYTPVDFIDAVYDRNEISDIFHSSGSRSGLSLAGILKVPAAKITLRFGYGNTVVSSSTYTITKEAEDIASVPRSWASLKTALLEMQPVKNKAAITETGKEFSLVTSNTSLLVLDRVEDYVRYGITPPEELRATYDSLSQEKHLEEAEIKNVPINASLDVMKQLKEWYNKNYLKKAKPKARPKPDAPSIEVDSAVMVVGNYNYSAAPVAVDSGQYTFSTGTAQLTVAETRLAEVSVTRALEGRAAGLQVRTAPGSDSYMRVQESDKNIADTGTYMWSDTIDSTASAIVLAEIKPDASYLKKLETASPANYYTIYLELKKEHSALPAFYVDAASFFYKKGNKALALQVLSNIAELQLEDAALLRVLGHKLQEWDEKALALETFKDVLELRGEHPQSWRDLALANADAGNYQAAADGLYHVLSHDRDRFEYMTGVVINEFNALISAHKQNINTSAYEKGLICSMPVDVRIVITWTSDDSDIDLWVTDPLNERCGYSSPLTNGGGRLSGDITTGFGPEEYCMKKAVNGNYTVDINYFGDRRQTIASPITVKAELYTNYGTPQQKKQVINLRLVSEKETITVGKLKFAAN